MRKFYARPVRTAAGATQTVAMGTLNSSLARVAPLHAGCSGAARPVIDLDAAERAVNHLLVALGRDLNDHSLRDTPRRVAAAYAELLTHEPCR